MRFRDCPRPNTVFWDGKIPSKMENGGVLKFPHTLVNRPRQLCKGHKFLVRTLIHAFLDSTESSLSLEFNKIKFSTKM